MEGLALKRQDLFCYHKKKERMSVYITNLCYYFIVVLRKALNEVDDDEEGAVDSQSEESENELENSLSSQSNTNADMYVYVA